MEVTITLDNKRVLELVREIMNLDDAYKLLVKALPEDSTILRDLKVEIEAYRNDFARGIYLNSDQKMVAIDLFKNLEFAERSGA